MNVKCLSLAFVAFIALNTPSSAVSLVTNGGFETGDFTGWTGGLPDNFVASGNASFVHTGNNGVAFGSAESLSDLSQSLTTVIGTTYDVTFWLNSNGVTPNEVKVTWGGLTIFDQTNITASGWTQYSFLETATSTSTLLDFGLRQDSFYSGLDDISVTSISAVPEASTWAMLLIGFAGIGFAAHRGGKLQRLRYATVANRMN